MYQDTPDLVKHQETSETKDNQQPQLSRWVKGLIWFNIILGIRFVISCFTQMIFEPVLGFIELVIQVIGIISLIGILNSKRRAFITWACYILTVCIFNCAISGSSLWLLFPLFSIGLMFLMLQIKRDGISAYDVLFNEKAVEEWKKMQQTEHEDNKAREGDKRISEQITEQQEEESNCLDVLSDDSNNNYNKEDLENIVYNVPEYIVNTNMTPTAKHNEIKSEQTQLKNDVGTSNPLLYYQRKSIFKYLLFFVFLLSFLAGCFWESKPLIENFYKKEREDCLKSAQAMFKKVQNTDLYIPLFFFDSVQQYGVKIITSKPQPKAMTSNRLGATKTTTSNHIDVRKLRTLKSDKTWEEVQQEIEQYRLWKENQAFYNSGIRKIFIIRNDSNHCNGWNVRRYKTDFNYNIYEYSISPTTIQTHNLSHYDKTEQQIIDEMSFMAYNYYLNLNNATNASLEKIDEIKSYENKYYTIVSSPFNASASSKSISTQYGNIICERTPICRWEIKEKDPYLLGSEMRKAQIITDIIIELLLIIGGIIGYFFLQRSRVTIMEALFMRIQKLCNPKIFMKPYDKDKVMLAQDLSSRLQDMQGQIDEDALGQIAQLVQDKLNVDVVGNFYIKQLKRKVHPKRFIKATGNKFVTANELYSQLESNERITYAIIMDIDRKASALYS